MSGQAEASSSSTFTAGSPPYDVFLNFRGVDTRKRFTGHLHNALDREGINVFMDSYKLSEGEEIGPTLFDAIQRSKASIIVFSENYASSKWCLEELVKICECYESKDQSVLPIFLHDNPSDVEHQRGSFEKAFVEHENKYGVEAVKPWRDALRTVANLKGLVLNEVYDGDESKLITHVVEWALEVTSSIISSDVKYGIGLESDVTNLKSFSNFGSKDVQFIGICGIAGIGKTAIAITLYNHIVREFHFRRSSFLLNIREEASKPNGLVSLQKKLIHGISKRKVHGEILSVESGKNLIKQSLPVEKVLLILDDVDDASQLDALTSNQNWFCEGSRVIITTRYENILKGANVDKIYRPQLLDDNQSLQLFRLHAFRKDEPFEEYMELSSVVARYSKGVPWVLEVLGSKLLGVRSKEVWKCTIRKWKEIALPNEAYERLNISYDKLKEDYEKSIFLDAGCFFTGWEKETVISIWDACGFFPRDAIDILIKWSLLNFEVNEDSRYYLSMHDQVRDMARQIVLKENFREPGKRSRLWFHDEIFEVSRGNRVRHDEILEGLERNNIRHEEILEVLEGNRGTDKVEGIFHPSDLQIDLDNECFEKMPNLRLLNINAKSFMGDFSRLPHALKWSQWKECPLDILPTNFYHKRLVHLHLSCSTIKQVWNIRPQEEKKQFNKLEILSLRDCRDLSKSPDFSWFPFLRQLDLRNCTSLNKLDESIGQLIHLKNLILDFCESLKKFPKSLSDLEDLESLDAIGCYNLTHTPRSRLGQGTLVSPDCSPEHSFPLTVNDGICDKVLFLCIVLEFTPAFMDELELEQQGPQTIYLDISATIRQNGKTVNCCHTLRIKDVEFKTHRDIIYIHPFEGFEWFGILLEGKDAIEISFIRQSKYSEPKSRVKFWKLLFERPDQQVPNVADFFNFSYVNKRKRCS